MVTLEIPDIAARTVHWGQALPASRCDPAALAERFRLPAGTIRTAAALAAAEASLAGRDAAEERDVLAALRRLHTEALETLAKRLPVSGGWDELAVCDETADGLALLESRCRNRERLRDAVGESIATQLTPGVRVLLTGPSGTGKTLAARLLASVVGKELYALDLSTVVNKYLGETEKNLDAVFSRAEELDVVLLLDEGDALLTRRTDVQTSNDRYANLETNFLLQRLESYGGILVVTTNAGERIDSAFRRRLDAVVEFRAPDAAERWAIWQLHLPRDHDVGEPLLNEAAYRCQMTGGQIRNAVLHASLLALDEGSAVGDAHVGPAIRREYRKAGAVCPLRTPAAAVYG
jgi:SpoVK/Ycf46/Vps4 family AAA+-type ATPase